MSTATAAPRLATRFAYGRKREITATTRPLDDDQIRAVAPSVFAETAHGSRSARYAYIPTSDVLRGLRREGFQVFSATQAIARREDKMDYTKHMLRLRHADQIARSKGGDVNEIILINSHDGASAYQMMGGCFRFVCSNGLICGTSYGEVRVRHSGHVTTEVVEGAYEVLRSFDAIDASKDRMQSLQLSDGEQRAFANAALAIRFPDRAPTIRPEQVVEARRWADEDASLWATFNRAQENLVQGGQRTVDTRRRTRTRAVRGIDGNVALNRGLWLLAEEMQRLKIGAAA